MKRFFTSDFHLGSTNIIKYCNRPFSSAEEMTNALVDNCNKIANKEDTIFHCGDFLLRGSDSHDLNAGKDESSLSCGINDIKCEISASLVLLSGNHDDKHNVESEIESMTISLNQNYHNVTVGHYPSYHKMYRYVGNSNRKTFNSIHVHLCGHVHDKWILHYDRCKNVLNINVGVDCWSYTPVRDSQLTELLDFVKNAKVKMPKDILTVDEFHEWFKMNKKHLEADRIFRKLARYAKKGLTDEERQRRKEAAMKAKGLL